jgi:hypothetical protein
MLASRPSSWLALTGVIGLLGTCAPAGAIEPGHLPADSEAALIVNFRQIRDSEMMKSDKALAGQIQALIEAQLAESGVQKYLERIDFDLFRDLDNLTVSTWGEPRPQFILLEGKFKPEKIIASAQQAAKENADRIKSIKIGDLQAFEIRPGGDEKPFYAGLVGTDKLVAAPGKNAFAEAVARLNGAKTSKLKKDFQALLDATSSKDSVRMVATAPALSKLLEDAPVPNADQVVAGLQNLEGLSLTVTVEKKIDFQLSVTAKEKQAADLMTAVTKGGLAALQVTLKKKAEKEPQLAMAIDVLKTMRVTSKNTTISVRGEITSEVLGKVLQVSPKEKDSGGPKK